MESNVRLKEKNYKSDDLHVQLKISAKNENS